MSEIAIISVEKELDPIREENLFLTIVISNIIWMIFHFTVVFFFTFQLKSILMVWVFMWIWNIFAFLLDISIWIIQKYILPKTLFTISFLFQILTMIIFINFTLQITEYLKNTFTPDDMWVVTDLLSFFLWNWMNLFLLLIASFCYWLSKELQEVTLVSYILNNANHNQYIYLIAKKNMGTWVWAFIWLVLSWFILNLNPNFIILLTIIMIILIIFFTSSFFDNSERTLEIKDIYKFRIFLDRNNVKNLGIDIKEKIVKSVSKLELKGIVDTSKYIFIKPLSISSWLTLRMLYEETKKGFISTYKIFTNSNNSLVIYWCFVILITFWFWDTFASTFLIKFLDNLWNWYWYVLLWLIAVPAFWFQRYFSKLSEKYWIYNVSNFWLTISWLSLFFMWVFAESNNIVLIISLAVINSVWYAACMTLSQAWFLEFYNKAYAEQNNLKEIDANASSAPFKIIWNLSTVLWFLFWWLLLSTLHYFWVFIFLWVAMIYILYWTRKNRIHARD